jgi:hypothetical protein
MVGAELGWVGCVVGAVVGAVVAAGVGLVGIAVGVVLAGLLFRQPQPVSIAAARISARAKMLIFFIVITSKLFWLHSYYFPDGMVYAGKICRRG